MHRAVCFLLLCLPALLRAGTVNWGNSFLSVNQTSSGAAMDGQMTFELGVFVPGFTPTAANTGQWAANWRQAQVAFYNVELAYFTGSHAVTSNAAPFTAGAKGYIWGHDGNCINGEWILMSAPGWTWPGDSQLELPVNWTVSTATQFITGQGNGSGFQMKSAPASGPLPSTSWNAWRARMFTTEQLANPNISGPEADPDSDGLANLGEYALGGHPRLGDGAISRITASLTPSGGRPRLTLTVRKRCDRPLLWSAQASLNLTTWPANSALLSDAAETFTAVENLTLSSDTRVFLRPVFQLP